MLHRLLEQSVLGPLYRIAIWARGHVWQAQRPMLLGVRVLIVTDRQVLLVRHRGGRNPWSIPGGGVERYERLPEAARREAMEETGAPVRIERLLGMYDHFSGGVSNYVAVFVCTPMGEPRPPRSLEIAEARFFPFDALPDGLERSSRRRIDEYRAGGHGLMELW